MTRRGCELRTGMRVVLALVALGTLAAASSDLARGDQAWARRAEGETAGRAKLEPVREAIRAYEEALNAHPACLESRWKLLRALHFAGEFVASDLDEARPFLERARQVSEESLERLARRARAGRRLDEMSAEEIRTRLDAAEVSQAEVARLYFWSAISWGAWSRSTGLLGAVRQGVANRLHRYILVTIALEPGYEEGGAFRLLGRLHAELPRIPFVSGWVDREQSIPLMEHALAMGPANPGNRLLLGLTLLDLEPERRGEALDLLAEVGRLTPRPTMRIEDLAMRREARARLARTVAEESS